MTEISEFIVGLWMLPVVIFFIIPLCMLLCDTILHYARKVLEPDSSEKQVTHAVG